MKVFTRSEYIWDGSRYVLAREEFFGYEGLIALCDRGQSKATAEQARGQSAQDQANAQAALAKTNSDLTNYEGNVSKFMKFGRDTYGANGEYMRDANTLANTTAAAGQSN